MDNASLGRCLECGANMDMVGLRHRCVPVARKVADEAKAPVVVGSERSGLTGDTYRYRDPVSRRAQVAAAMRRWRSRKARRGGVGAASAGAARGHRGASTQLH
jgi:hypothetical protein